MGAARSFPIVLNETFIQSTRDTGYRSTASAVAELVDNSLQAKARSVQIFIVPDAKAGPDELAISVVDDGSGMDASTLRRSLQFGGTSRFNDRSGPGRFGMGLPNASMSQAQRVDVWTWQAGGASQHTYLDLREVAEGETIEIPRPRRKTLPPNTCPRPAKSGTLVRWTRCDRLDNRRISTIARKLQESLGQMFRYFLWNGVKITINGEAVVPIDPLFLDAASPLAGAKPFGETLAFEVRCPRNAAKTSVVRARFSEFPIQQWYNLPQEEKRRLRIIGGAGVSVIRAGREVDYGWFFFGPKRRENYDDWWRCELSFEPELDELFGINHSKQAINPTSTIKEILSPDMEAAARSLNVRVQAGFAWAKSGATPLFGSKPGEHRPATIPINGKRSTSVGSGVKSGKPGKVARRGSKNGHLIEVGELPGTAFYDCQFVEGVLRIKLNSEHSFAKLFERSGGSATSKMRALVETLLVAAARAECCEDNERRRVFYRKNRMEWGRHLTELLESKR